MGRGRVKSGGGREDSRPTVAADCPCATFFGSAAYREGEYKAGDEEAGQNPVGLFAPIHFAGMTEAIFGLVVNAADCGSCLGEDREVRGRLPIWGRSAPGLRFAAVPDT